MLKLMYITNRPDVAVIAESAGVGRIFVDMEYIGKDARQHDMDTVKSHHTVQDAAAVKRALTSAELMVRVNPIHEATPEYCSSKEEIDSVIEAGADVIMLPYFKTADEARSFISLVGGRARTMLLVETPEAVELADEIIALPGIDEMYVGLNDLSLGSGRRFMLETPEAVSNIDGILSVPGIDEVHIGLNDLSIGMGKKFMFELLADGTVESLAVKLRGRGIPFGFGGIASIGQGAVPAEYIIKEHYRLGSSFVILSRSMCDVSKIGDIEKVREILTDGVRKIRGLERECAAHSEFFFESRRELIRLVESVKKGAEA